MIRPAPSWRMCPATTQMMRVLMIWCLLDGVVGQLGLVSLGGPVLLSGPQPHYAPLLSHQPHPTLRFLAPPPPAPRKSPAVRESEIAAVFRGVAYGDPTTTAPSTTTSRTTTTTTRSRSTSSTPAESQYQVSWSQGMYKEVDLVPHSATSAPAASGPSDARENNAVLPESPTIILNKTRPWRGGSMGVAWLVHVYGAGTLLAVLAGVAVIVLARTATTPALGGALALVGVAAGLRAGWVLGGYNPELPAAPIILLDRVPWPCLTLALALLLLSHLPRPSPASRHHLALLLPLLASAPTLLALASHITALTLPHHAPPLTALATALIATGGGGVALAGLWVLWQSRQEGLGLLLGQRGGHKGMSLALMACLAQVASAALTLCMVAVPMERSSDSWALWIRVSFARCLEVLVGVSVVGGVAVMGHGRPDTALLATLRRCGRDSLGGRGADVFPTSPDKLATLTLKPPPPWYCPNQTLAPGSAPTYLPQPRPSMLVNDAGFLRFRPLEDPAPRAPQPSPTHCPARYYCAPAATLANPRRHRAHRTRTGSASRRHQTLPAPPARRRDTEGRGQYQVAPYCLPVPAPPPVYATPHFPAGSLSSLSEVQVDYLTDVSSSTDVLHLDYRPNLVHSGPTALAFTLALPPAPPSPWHSTPTSPHQPDLTLQLTPENMLGLTPDLTPDSAVVLDYCTSEEEPTPNSAPPLNMQSAGRSGLLGRLVGRGVGYSPLDDVSSPSVEAAVPPSSPLAPIHYHSSLPSTPSHISPPLPLSVTPL